MKNFLLKSLMMILLGVLFTLNVYADYRVQINGLYYNLNSTFASVSSYNQNTGSVTIPSSVSYNGIDYPVRGIGEFAFSNCKGLTSVTIPNSVITISSYAFKNCSSLTSVSIPNSVVSISFGAFEGCSALTSIIVEDGNIIYDSRDNCNAIIKGDNTLIVGCKNTVIPNNVTKIGDGAFSGCSALTSINIPNNVASIGISAFSGCCGLTSITIPNSVTEIDYGAFYGCSGLTSIIIPTSVTSIGYGKNWIGAFDGCSGLKTIIVENGNSKYDSRGNCNAIIEKASNTILWGCQNTVIPNDVTKIGDGAFSGCSGLTSITIPNNVTSIGDYAFEGCSSLESITIPNSVTTIGNGAFFGCSGLTSITIPNNVTSIGDYAFEGCSSLESITIPNSVTTIGNGAFFGCSGLTSITIPNSVTSIGDGAFSECSGLTSVDIPNSVTSIGDYTFSYCSGLTSVTIPDGVTSIGSEVFHGCYNLYDPVYNSTHFIYMPENCYDIEYYHYYEIPYGITTICGCAFEDCYELTSLIIPSSVTCINDHAFYSCYDLKSVKIPNSVTSIGNYAFSSSGLTSVTIPNSVTSIGNYAFSWCSSLASVLSLIEEPFTLDPKSNAFSNLSSNCTLTIPYGTKDAYIAKGWTEEIFKGGIFEKSPNVQNITFADAEVKQICVDLWDTDFDGELSEDEAAAVTFIGNVFEYQYGITSFDEFEYFTGVTSIGEDAFQGCSGLTSMTIPNSVTSIGNYAFANCGLTSLTIPNSVTSIGNNAFQGCNSLIDISVESENTVYDSRDNCNAIIETESNTLIVGCSKTVIPNSVTTIGGNAFYNCSELTSVTIPNSVTTIGNWAFCGCSGLTSVTIGKGVSNIGSYAFYLCKNLTDISVASENTVYDSRDNCNAIIETASNTLIKGCSSTFIPNSVTSIGNYAFQSCSGLTSLSIPNSVTSIGDNAFQSCSGLTSLSIPNSVTSIGDYAFSSCSGLTSVNFSNSLTSIGRSAFQGCSGLTSMAIPNSLTSIGDYFLYSCSGLTSVTIPNSVTSIGYSAFQYCSGLTSVISDIEDPFTFFSYTFYGISSNCILTVPYGKKDAYIAKGWTEDVFKGGIVEAYNIASENYLTITDTEVCKGGSITLPVNMDNTESITALQFEISLPAGVTPSKCQLTDRKGEDHTTSYKKLVNGNYQVTAFSGSKAVFSGTEGAVLSLTLDVNKDITEGDYPISITNIELTTVATKAINPVGVSATLTVSDVKVGDVDGNGRVSITDAVAIVSHILGEDIDGFVAAAADVDGNGKITITDAVAIVDMILNGTASANERADVEENTLDPQ